MYLLTPKMYLLAPKMDKSLPFDKVQLQWQLLYPFFWECTFSRCFLYIAFEAHVLMGIEPMTLA